MAYGLGLQITSYYKRGAVLAGRIVREANMHLVVPITYTENSKINFKIIFYAGLTAMIILVELIMIKVLKFTPNIWTPFYVFSLLFGVTVPKKPYKRMEKLIYISLAVVSIKYSSDVFAVFTGDDVTKDKETVFDAFEEIKRPTLTLYIGKTHFQDKVNYDDEIIQNLKAHSKLVSVAEDCYRKLSSQKDRFIFNSAIYVGYMMKKYSNPDRSPRMKLSNPIVLGDYFAHVFAKNSPYIEIFDKKFEQIFESGLHDSIYYGKNYLPNYRVRNQHGEFKPSNDLKYQLIIFFTGCIFAIIIFVFELLSKCKLF